jgi:hypothetical protein
MSKNPIKPRGNPYSIMAINDTLGYKKKYNKQKMEKNILQIR